MKFSLINFFLLTASLSLGQTKIFVKFNDNVKPQNIKNRISAIVFNSSLSKTNNSSKQVMYEKSFYEKFGHLTNNLDRTTVLTIGKNINTDKFIKDLKQNENIDYIEKLKTYKIDVLTSDDSLLNKQWGLKSVHAPEAWKIFPEDATKVLLAVIDTGIDYKHPDLKNVLFINKGEVGLDKNGNDKRTNGIDDDNNGFVDDYRGWDFVNKIDAFNATLDNDFTDWDNNPMDENKHGTIVSGIIGAEHNTIGIAGVNPNIKILNLRAFDKNGEGEEDDVASAIIYAVKMGAKVINMSFGDKIYSQVLKDVIEYAHSKNVVLVASAGNSASYLTHYPSGFNEVISVGAIQQDELLASFSNYGSTIDLVAPGTQILSTTLDNKYQKVSGTSVSAPFVSAAAAMLLSVKNFTNDEIKQILKSTAKDLGASGWDEKYGAGNLNILKCLQLPVPSEIKINNPKQDYFVKNNLLEINISVLSPYFKSFNLSYGKGFNPTNWSNIFTGKENSQLLNEDVYQLNTSNFNDTTYTLRLLVNNINGTTTEERVNFHIDKTKPKVKYYSIIPAIQNDAIAFTASVYTDDKTIAQLFFKPYNNQTELDSIYLDGITEGQKFNRNSHFGIVFPNRITSNGKYEFYFKLTNRAGLKTIFKSDNGKNFIVNNNFNKQLKATNKKAYELPMGRIYRAPVYFDSSNSKYVLINETKTSSDLSIYKSINNGFTKMTILKHRIPVSVGDFNKDGKTDILSLFVKKGFIETQTSQNKLEFKNVFKDTSGTFWPSFAGDIDNDTNTEIIAFSSDTTFTIWEVQKDFQLIKEKTLYNFVGKENPQIKKSVFRNNQILVGSFNNNLQKEIITIDNYGRILTYNINGANTYSDGNVHKIFPPTAVKAYLSQGDFNGNGINEIGIFAEFEDEVFITPVKYCAVISLKNSSPKSVFERMFVDISSSFVSAYEKKYNSITFANLNNNNRKELLINSYPNAYIFDYKDSTNINLMFYKTDVNSQSIFYGDLDNNGFNDVAISNSAANKNIFYDFNNTLLPPPVIKEYYSIDSTHNFIEWENINKPAKIFYGKEIDNLILKDSTLNNKYIFEALPNTITYYQLAFYNKENGKIISEKSKIFSIYSHAPAKISGLKILNSKSIEIVFTNRIKNKELHTNSFIIDSVLIPNSVYAGSQYSIIITLKKPLEEGSHFLTVKNLRDFYNSPVPYFSNNFIVKKQNKKVKNLYISSYKILDNHTLNIIFNFNLDSISALNKNNYLITPNNLLSSIKFYKSSKKTIQIKTEKPFGSIGLEYTLIIKNLHSTKETGYVSFKENVGNQIVLVTTAKNINNVYVYPNPVNFETTEHVTFANLTSNVEIYIYNLTGKFIKKLTVEDSNGGITWNLKDENNKIVNSGIYIYRVVAYNSIGEKIEEKIGKFAVTR